MFHGMDGGGSMWFGWIFWLILFIGIIWGVLALVNKNKNNDQNFQVNETTLEILKRRYAAGEIDTNEYEERKKILDQDTQK